MKLMVHKVNEERLHRERLPGHALGDRDAGGFLTEAWLQESGNWRAAYEALTLINQVRAGYDLAAWGCPHSRSTPAAAGAAGVGGSPGRAGTGMR
jgi:hypothetical protein